MHNWLFLSIMSSAIMTGALAAVSLLLWLRQRQKFLFYWMIGWILFFVRYGMDLFNVAPHSFGWLIQGFVDACACLSLIFIFLGFQEMKGRIVRERARTNRWIWLVPIITTLWSLAANLNHNPQLGSLLPVLATGLIQLWIGIQFLKVKPLSGQISSRVLGYGMILWGLHKFNYPILRFIPELAPLGYLLGGLFAFVTSIFMLLLVIENTSHERDISLERFRILLQNSVDIVLFMTSDGRIVDANPSAVTAYGYSREELLGMSIYQLRRSEAQPLAVTQTGQSLETVNYRKDGSFFPVEVNTVGGFSGGQWMLMSIIRDISGRKQAEAALRGSEEKFRELFHNANDMIFLYNSAAAPPIVEVNRIAMQRMGYDRDAFNRVPVPDLFVALNRDLLAKIREALKSEGRATFEMTLRTKTGAYLPVEVNAHSFALNGQQVLLSIARDISERKKAEAEIRNLTFTDQLTGVSNRVYLEETLKTFDFPSRLPLSVIIGDVNGLKLVNDAFGHSVGDELLKGIADLIRAACRKDDIIVRWGGDEFLLLLAQTDYKSAEQVCRRIQSKCREEKIQHLQPSIALGYAVMENAAQNIQELFRMADERMYRNKLLESKSARNAIIVSLQKTLYEKSNETEQHAERLKNLALDIGDRIGLPQNQRDDLVLLAKLHDIGKIAIPEEILNKPGRLTEAEWQTMKKHPEIGYRIIQSVPDMIQVAEAVLAHHERWDGGGYPRGLKQGEIPLISRIIAIVDSFDAMTHQRVYRNLMGREAALAEIAHCAGSQFDPELTALFLEIVAGAPEAAAAAAEA